MVVKLSPETEQAIEQLMESSGITDADELVSSALAALSGQKDAYWERIARLDAEADESVALGRFTRVDEAFVAGLRERVRVRTGRNLA